MPAWLPAAITGAATLGSSLLGSRNVSRTNKARARLQREANEQRMELAEHAFEKDVAMWKMQRDYNRPEAQMERLKAAGLNPHLVYGTGTVTGNMAGTPPSYQTPSVGTPQVQTTPPPDFGGAAQATLGGMSQVKQLEQIELGNYMQRLLNQSQMYKNNQEKFQSSIAGVLENYRLNNPEEATELIVQDWKAKSSMSQLQELGQELKNAFQKDINRLSKYGLRLGDAKYITVGISVLEALGIDTIKLEEMIKQLNP